MREGRAAWFYLPAVAAPVVDQLTKSAARRLLEYDRPVGVIPGFFDLRLSYNSGGAFGILPSWAPLFIIIALAAIFAIVKLSKAGAEARSLAVGLGLLLGGAVGNLIDRLFSRAREVTDFLSLHITYGGKTYTWPTFNVADIAIVIGAALVFFYVHVVGKRKGEA